MNEPTIFQKIIDRDIPADIVYEDDQVIAFLDIRPVHKGHTLVVPKTPYRWFLDMPSDEYAYLMMRTQDIAKGMKRALECELISVVIIGEEVPHVHVWLVPDGNGSYGFEIDRTAYENPEESSLYAERIKKAL